jgi:hypothetical protein
MNARASWLIGMSEQQRRLITEALTAQVKALGLENHDPEYMTGEDKDELCILRGLFADLPTTGSSADDPADMIYGFNL